MRIVFCSSEVVPFAKTGGLADVCGALPLALEELGHDVFIFLPYYRSIQNGAHTINSCGDGIYETTIGKNIRVLLIENNKLFDREGLYGYCDDEYDDNLERFQFFCERVLKALKNLDLKVDIIHCHDWQTALIPVYLKSLYQNDEFFAQTKSVLTIHNLAFHGLFDRKQWSKLKLDDDICEEKFAFFEKINLFKAGLLDADRVTTVSPQYAKEILTKEYGCGLQDVLTSRNDEVIGILNGLDYNVWRSAIEGEKATSKTELQKSLDLQVRPEVPILGFVGRIAHQKGMDIILASLDDLLEEDIQIVIQGVGDEDYYKAFYEFAKRYPQKLALKFEFNQTLAQHVYAGSDLFLMPSYFEPCGLSQMIALACGTIPIVYKTGGLADTIIDYTEDKEHGNGFMFTEYVNTAFLEAVKRALDSLADTNDISQLKRNALAVDFSWRKSALEYQNIYQCLLSD